MNVPPYVPPPIELPRNVGDGPFSLRVRFIRRVSVMFLVSLVWVFGLSALPWPQGEPLLILAALIVSLLGLSFIRWLARGRPSVWEEPMDEMDSLPEFPVHRSALGATLLIAIPMFLLLGWALRLALIAGWPMAPLLVGQTLATLYVLLSGRDLSFMGMFSLPLLGSTVILLSAGALLRLPPVPLWFGVAVNAGFLLYTVYDLAMLLSRRRSGEELLAVIDLYRDPFNLFTYLLRCLRHWKKIRPWAR